MQKRDRTHNRHVWNGMGGAMHGEVGIVFSLSRWGSDWLSCHPNPCARPEGRGSSEYRTERAACVGGEVHRQQDVGLRSEQG